MYLRILLLFGMLFLHIVDDYYLQGWLASAKQKSWWEKNAPDKLYSKDYIMALCEHAFSWTFMIMLIPGIYTYFTVSDPNISIYYIWVFFLNWLIHCFVDHMKANRKEINLIVDQLIHILQVILAWYGLIGL